MRDGAPMEPRLIATFAPPPPGPRLAKVIAFAPARHMMPRKPVEERIAASFPKAAGEAAETSRQARLRSKLTIRIALCFVKTWG